MARISGVDIPREKRVVVSLTYLHGIGRTVAENICEAAGVDFSTRVKDLSDDEVVRIRTFIDEQLTVEGDLRREVSQNIKRKMDIGCYEARDLKKTSGRVSGIRSLREFILFLVA